MTYKTITGVYAEGYILQSGFTGLYIAKSADVGGSGVGLGANKTVINSGHISGGNTAGGYRYGIDLYGQNERVVNNKSGYIYGTYAIAAYDAGMTVINSGHINFNKYGIDLRGGGYVLNTASGSIAKPFVLGYHNSDAINIDGAATVDNFGLIEGGASYKFTGGGNVISPAIDIGYGTILNGAPNATSALISGLYSAVAVRYGAGTVINYGAIRADGADGQASTGVNLARGGVLINGSQADDKALIAAEYAVNVSGARVANFGTIQGEVLLYDGSSLVNEGPNNRAASIASVKADATSVVTNYATIGSVYTSGGLFNDAAAVVRGSDPVMVAGGGSVSNLGTIEAVLQSTRSASAGEYGAQFLAGGRFVNGSADSLLAGYGGVKVSGGDGAVMNYGLIEAYGESGQIGVDLAGSGGVTNGGLVNLNAVIDGYGVLVEVTKGTVTNFGTLLSDTGGTAVSIGTGDVTNGAVDFTCGVIKDTTGIVASGRATIVNYNLIAGAGGAIGQSGVILEDGGIVTNGGTADTSALIFAVDGISVTKGVVDNFGTVNGYTHAGEGGGVGVTLDGASRLNNGSAGDHAALIDAYQGVVTNAPATLVNFGTILGSATIAPAVTMDDGSLINGEGSDTAALIEGAYGVASSGAATITNLGSIIGTGGVGFYGVVLATGGILVNGSTANASALIQGYGGANLVADVTATNFGTIAGDGESQTGAVVGPGSTLANGAAGHVHAIIEGYVGVSLSSLGGATLTNFGTINGEGGAAVSLGAASDVLVAEADSTFEGAVKGGGGTLALGSGTGTLTGLLAGGDVTVSDGMATTTFTDFGAVMIDAGASFALAGAGGTVAKGQALTVDGTLSGVGTLALNGGTANFGAGASLAIAKVKVAGATAAVSVETSLTYAGTWTQSAGKLTVATGDRITFTGKGNSFTGTLTGPGALAFTGGSDTLSGAITLSANLTITTPNLIVAAGGATLGGTGELILSNTATNSLHGASAAATLTDNGKIVGAGMIGGGVMTLVIGARGFVNGNQALALTIDTGTNTISNAGIIYAVGAGGTIVKSTVNNTGKLYADGGTLTLDGAVTGAGQGYINRGILDAASTFAENVTFTSAGGTLELAKSQTYTGTIAGFAKTSITSLDLLDIAFGTKTKATYSGTPTSGVLTVTDGTHTAKIKLAGNYAASAFTVSSDGHGGTKVVDPPAAAGQAHAFIAAMAGFGGGGGGLAPSAPAGWRSEEAILATPG